MSTLSPGDAGAWPAAANGASSEYPDAGLNNDTAAAEDNAPARPPPRKRRRIVISCTECHRRKQKVCLSSDVAVGQRLMSEWTV